MAYYRYIFQKAFFKRGEVVLSAVIFFLISFLLVVTGVTLPTITDVSRTRENFRSMQSFALAEGLVEDIGYRLREGIVVSPSEVLVQDATTASAVITSPHPATRLVSSIGSTAEAVRKVGSRFTIGSGVSFNFGIQTDNGGLLMENSSSVRGNIYSNGPIEGQNSNIVRGSVISAGSMGIIDGINATSSAYANEIRNAYIEGSAYYQTIDPITSVLGTKYPGSVDQPTSLLPITDVQINAWEVEAEAGGIISGPCPYEITSDITIGPVKIECNLTIRNNPVVTLNGNVWVTGSIEIRNSSILQASALLGNQSVMIIADDPSNRLTSSTIILRNSSSYLGSGSANSYVLLLSQNESAELGGTIPAIEIENSASGDLLLYAGHGEILLKNSVQLNEVTAWRVHLKNTAEVIYKSGLASLLFTGGPAGGYAIERWVEEP
jgi:hypothetical protein